ncbi:hypothetical protein YC2023_067362 [Brassica napus]
MTMPSFSILHMILLSSLQSTETVYTHLTWKYIENKSKDNSLEEINLKPHSEPEPN